jgi:acetoin utilization protein AcuB
MDLDAPVASLMTPRPITTTPEATLTDLWTLMLNRGFHHVPVLAGGQLVGVLSRTDVMRAMGMQDPTLVDTGVILDTEHKVADLMTRHVRAIEASVPLRRAVSLFAEGHLHCLPVLDGEKVIGMLTTTDVMRALLR